MKSGISVIICCYNSERRLPETLRHLLQQRITGIDWEILVVDNASKDGTGNLAQQILSESLSANQYKVVDEIEPGLSSARRKGYLTSQYDHLLFCDDDNWLEENYLPHAYELMEANPQIGILGGIGEAIFENDKPFWFDNYQLNFAVGPQTSLPGRLVKAEGSYGAGFMILKEVFEALDDVKFVSLLSDRKGSQLMSGGDTELCLVTKYLGYEIYVSDELRFKHLMTKDRMNWAYLKKLYYGFGRMRLYLHAYKYIEQQNDIPGQGLRLPLWADRYIHLIRQLLKYYPQILFKLNEEGNDEVLKFNALKGELFELRTLKERYAQIFSNIINLRERIAAFKTSINKSRK